MLTAACPRSRIRIRGNTRGERDQHHSFQDYLQSRHYPRGEYKRQEERPSLCPSQS